MRMSARVDGVASRVQSAIQMRQVSLVRPKWVDHCECHLGDSSYGWGCEINGCCLENHELGKGSF